MIADGAVVPEDDEPVEAAEEPPIVGHRDHRAVELGETVLERLGRHEVEVVGRLVEQEQRRAADLEQQDLEPGLLPTAQRLERLVCAAVDLVPAEHAHRRAEHDVVVVQDLDERPTDPLRMLVGLVEQSGDDVGAESPRAGRLDRPVAGEQSEEVALADAVAAEHRHPLAVPELEVERFRETGHLELLGDDRTLAGSRAAEPNVDLSGRAPPMVARSSRGTAGAWTRPP